MLASNVAMPGGMLLLVGVLSILPAGVSAAEAGVLRIELASEASNKLAEVFISPGTSTIFAFDSRFLHDRVVLEGRERFARVEMGETTLRLVSSERLKPGERLSLVVRFDDGSAPASAAFTLVVQPAQAVPLVEVFRHRRTVESYQQEAEEARQGERRCRDDLFVLQSEREGPGGLTGLLLSGVMDRGGVMSRPLPATHSGTLPITFTDVRAFISVHRLALKLAPAESDAVLSWRPVRATLRDEQGKEVKVQTVRIQQPSQQAPGGSVIVEMEVPDGGFRGRYTLRLWEADTDRVLTFGNLSLF